MKKILWFSWALVVCSFSGIAQTNVPAAASSPHFFLPPVQLWQPAATEENTATNTFGMGGVGDDSLGQMSSALDQGEFRSRVIKPGEFYLVQQERPSNNRIVRAAETLWTPEVVTVGKTKIASPIITAIKRKNPLCLLNPLVFQASW
jgi:hypothetical protein